MDKHALYSFVRSKMFAGIVMGTGVALILIVVFEAGEAVGYHEALFSSRWGQNYSRNFGGDDFMGMPGEHNPAANGTSGKILDVSSSTLIIASGQNPEQRIVLGDDTLVRDHSNTIATSSLKIGQFVVVLGDPDDRGEILAKLIRVVPTTP